MPLNCLPNCVREDQPKAFEDITAEPLEERLLELVQALTPWRS